MSAKQRRSKQPEAESEELGSGFVLCDSGEANECF